MLKHFDFLLHVKFALCMKIVIKFHLNGQDFPDTSEIYFKIAAIFASVKKMHSILPCILSRQGTYRLIPFPELAMKLFYKIYGIRRQPVVAGGLRRLQGIPAT